MLSLYRSVPPPAFFSSLSPSLTLDPGLVAEATMLISFGDDIFFMEFLIVLFKTCD